MNEPRFHLVCGPDDFLVQRLGRELWEQLSQGLADDFGREIVNGTAGNVGEVENSIRRFCGAVQTLPMFGERKAVWFKDVTFLADSVTGRAEGTAIALAQMQKALLGADPRQVAVLITASPVDRRKKDFKWFSEHGEVRLVGETSRRDETGSAIIALIQEEAHRQGIVFQPDAAALLAARIEGNSRLAIEEVRKLAVFLGSEPKPVDEALVTALVPPFGEGDMFETAEAFYAGNLGWALDALRRHFFAGHDARPLLTNLQNRNRLLIQLRVLLDSGELSGSITQGNLDKAALTYGKYFGENPEKSSLNLFTQNPWYLSRLSQTARLHPLKKLIQYETQFLKAFTGFLERPREEEEVLRECLVRCLG